MQIHSTKYCWLSCMLYMYLHFVLQRYCIRVYSICFIYSGLHCYRMKIALYFIYAWVITYSVLFSSCVCISNRSLASALGSTKVATSEH